MNLQRGFRDKLEKYFDINQDIDITMNTFGSSVYDYCCFGVDSANKLSDDRYMVFYNQTSSPNGEIRLNGSSGFRVSLRSLPLTVNKLVFTVSIDGNGTMGNISSHSLKVSQNNNSALELNLSGTDFHSEKAIISIEIYRKDTWRIAVIAGGFNGGLKDLLKFYGGTEISAPKPAPVPKPAPRPAPRPAPTPAPEPVRLKKVELKKGQKVNLQKSGSSLGEILINLNWSQPSKKSFFFLGSNAIDLDLGCLYEMKNGKKGCVQALGNAFGSLDRFPFIALDGDDRTGANSAGENLRINGKMISQIKRILIYTFIYEGVANWKQADGVVTVKCPGSPDIIVKMDEYGSNLKTCAIALLENQNDETFSVEKVVRFFSNQEPMDRAFGWNMQWSVGRK